MRVPAILFSVLALASAPDAAAQVYKWVDEKGKVQYGESPPPNVKATPINVPSAPADAPAQPSWKEKELASQKGRIERERKETSEANQARAREGNRDAACNDARRRLAVLEEQIVVYQRNDKGERVYLDDKDRPAEIARYQRIAAENCR